MPLRTLFTSAPYFSHRLAISLMKLILHASMALLAYFTISALRTSMIRIGWPWRTNGSYSSRITLPASSLSTPHTTRSGLLKSVMASPSFRNSGLSAMWKGTLVRLLIRSRTLWLVPTGTVLFTTTVLVLPPGPMRSSSSAMSFATASTYCRSALPSSSLGVPTQMKMVSAWRYASALSRVKRIRLAAMFFCSISLRPGS